MFSWEFCKLFKNTFLCGPPLVTASDNTIFTTEPMKCTWFSRKIFAIYRKWKIKNVVVLDMWSAIHFEAFFINQAMLFLHASNVLGMRRACTCNHMPHMWKPDRASNLLFKITQCVSLIEISRSIYRICYFWTLLILWLCLSS